MKEKAYAAGNARIGTKIIMKLKKIFPDVFHSGIFEKNSYKLQLI